jgi:hypothetical protein
MSPNRLRTTSLPLLIDSLTFFSLLGAPGYYTHKTESRDRLDLGIEVVFPTPMAT